MVKFIDVLLWPEHYEYTSSVFYAPKYNLGHNIIGPSVRSFVRPFEKRCAIWLYIYLGHLSRTVTQFLFDMWLLIRVVAFCNTTAMEHTYSKSLHSLIVLRNKRNKGDMEPEHTDMFNETKTCIYKILRDSLYRTSDIAISFWGFEWFQYNDIRMFTMFRAL